MNAIQEARMKGYFITAAKDLIRGEGLAVVSTRNVAERAGYSYATLYNYFKDVRDLIFQCVGDFMEECREFVRSNAQEGAVGSDGLDAVSRNYAKFFVQYPGIFALFYEQKPSEMSTSTSDLAGLYSFFDSLTERHWNEIAAQKNCSAEELRCAREHHKLAIHGLLMFYLNRRMEDDFNNLLSSVGQICAISATL